ncbi:non-specific serine,threonine protein kinase [Sarracenia purpurea var. burkii]
MGRMGRGGKSYSANPKDYKLLEEVGHGASATVFRAIYLPFNEVVAVKSMDLDRCNSNLFMQPELMKFCSEVFLEIRLGAVFYVSCDFHLFDFACAVLIQFDCFDFRKTRDSEN